MGQRREQRLVLVLIAQLPQGGFCRRVLLRLAKGDVVALDADVLRLARDRPTGQIGAVFEDVYSSPAADGEDLRISRALVVRSIRVRFRQLVVEGGYRRGAPSKQ